MKKFKLAAILCLSALMLTACSGGSDKTVDVDVKKLASSINSEAVTSDTLTEVADNMISTIYFTDDSTMAAGSAYTSSGATADEVCVIECPEESKTADVEKLFKTRVQNQSDLYASYNADEVKKLDKAIIKSAGKYVVLAVVDDTAKAESLLKDAGF